MTGSTLAAGASRKAAHAGTFYPAHPASLVRQVDRLLEEARSGRRLAAGLPLGLLVPHAGIDWCGSVAARAWLELEPNPLRAGPPPTVVLLGTNHFDRGSRGVSVWSGGPWLTPLGQVAVDVDLRGRVLDLGPPFAARAEPHLAEHSIEVELPFLRRIRPDARVVPLLVGPIDDDDRNAAGAALGRLLAGVRDPGRPLVLVASSDLAHYPSRSVADNVDDQSLHAMTELDADRLSRHELAAEASAIRGLDCALCGIDPVCLAMAALRAMGATRGRVLAHATSADTPAGTPERVVGYGAVRFD
jgi:AmmeMemoRadiSam system protein B